MGDGSGETGRCRATRPSSQQNRGMRPAPGGLIDGQQRPRALRLAGPVDWYVAGGGVFELVGTGDVSAADAEAVREELARSAAPLAVFVCVSRRKGVDELLAEGKSSGPRRQRWASRRKPMAPSVAAVARGARIAVLPGSGAVWVDAERIFPPGDRVPLPWTSPRIDLESVRPKTVREAMRLALGKDGPRRATIDEG